MTIKAVIFDLGNVLIGWQPEVFFDSVIGEDRRRAFFAAVDLHGMNDGIDAGANFHDTLARTAKDHPDWAEELGIWHDRWIDMAAPLITHSERLMYALQAKGMPVFSLTNFGIQTYDLAAESYPFMRKFDRDFISGHMGVIKPDPVIYQMLEDASGLSGDALLFADDRQDNIDAANARGWNTHLFEHPQGWANCLVAAGLLTRDEAQ